MRSVTDWLKLGLLVVFYILLGLFGVYSKTLIFLFPLTAIPLTIYLMGNKKDIRKEYILHIMIILGIYLVGTDYRQSILYILSVVIPAYLVIALYRKSLHVPKIIMIVGITMGGALIGYVIAVKYLGVDYVQIYLNALDHYQTLQIEVFNNLATQGVVTGFTKEDLSLLKEIVSTQVAVFKLVYPALFLLVCVFLSTLYIMLITVVGNLKGWRLPSLKQLLYFRFSPIAAVLIILGMLAIQLDRTQQGIWSITGFNIYFLLSSLFQFIGIIAIIMIIRKLKMGTGLKIIGILVSIFIFCTMPLAMTVVGLGDSLFNYRKVENTV